LDGIFGLRQKTARLRLGDESIELTEYLTPKGREMPRDSRANDLWFQHIAIIVSDMDKAYDWLWQNGVQYASPSPQRLPDWNTAAAGIRAFYFRDPDGHFLEILQFPPDKGTPKWHESASRLFLGIDHTAIVVKDTDSSMHFYRDLLGMRVVGESDNYGPEQERLNNVFGAHLRITSLAGDSGPGIEFLQYLAPSDGRPYPSEEKPNDLIHWRTIFAGLDVESAVKQLREANAPTVSSGIVSLRVSESAFQKSVIFRDPDGHAIELTGGGPLI
jgi:catechol 2,3-dioxygenase-like lactoylglutathione lyase family enzyme